MHSKILGTGPLEKAETWARAQGSVHPKILGLWLNIGLGDLYINILDPGTKYSQSRPYALNIAGRNFLNTLNITPGILGLGSRGLLQGGILVRYLSSMWGKPK